LRGEVAIVERASSHQSPQHDALNDEPARRRLFCGRALCSSSSGTSRRRAKTSRRPIGSRSLALPRPTSLYLALPRSTSLYLALPSAASLCEAKECTLRRVGADLRRPMFTLVTSSSDLSRDRPDGGMSVIRFTGLRHKSNPGARWRVPDSALVRDRVAQIAASKRE